MKTVFLWLAVLLVLTLALYPSAVNPIPKAAAQPPAQAGRLGGGGPPLLYQFTGVRDDGAKSVSGKSATSLHCTNLTAASAAMSYYVYNFDNSAYYYVNFDLLAGQTITISTQYTSLYTDDIVLRASDTSDHGTGVIDQGLGQVYSTSKGVICSAQVLDPINTPPTFVTRLTLFTDHGLIARRVRSLYLPVLRR